MPFSPFKNSSASIPFMMNLASAQGNLMGPGSKKPWIILPNSARISASKSVGFKVRHVDGHAVELEVGEEGSPLIGIYGHSDVVPVSGTWEVPPFSATLKEDKIIGRGALDDKGPLTASLFAVKLLKDNGLIKGYRVKIVLELSEILF